MWADWTAYRSAECWAAKKAAPTAVTLAAWWVQLLAAMWGAVMAGMKAGSWAESWVAVLVRRRADSMV